jgi:hypothetical protein
VIKGEADDPAILRLHTLLKLETTISAVRAWPIDTRSFGSISFLLLLPLLSWLSNVFASSFFETLF